VALKAEALTGLMGLRELKEKRKRKRENVAAQFRR